MSFRLVSKSVTLNDLERRNGRVFCVISQNSVDFGAYYVKLVEDTPILLQQKCSAKNVVFGDISFMAIWRPSEDVKLRRAASENLTNNRP